MTSNHLSTLGEWTYLPPWPVCVLNWHSLYKLNIAMFIYIYKYNAKYSILHTDQIFLSGRTWVENTMTKSQALYLWFSLGFSQFGTDLCRRPICLWGDTLMRWGKSLEYFLLKAVKLPMWPLWSPKMCSKEAEVLMASLITSLNRIS